MKNILITGGAGYIGSKLATKLLELNFNVTVLDVPGPPEGPVEPKDVHKDYMVVHWKKPKDDGVKCERCGADMFRMHAVWRCPVCGYKTDCCGW